MTDLKSQSDFTNLGGNVPGLLHLRVECRTPAHRLDLERLYCFIQACRLMQFTGSGSIVRCLKRQGRLILGI